MMAADGVSIIAPISSWSSNGTLSLRNSSLNWPRNALACINSSRPEIMGYMIFTLPSALARKMARSCARKNSSCCRQKRIARQPRNGFISCRHGKRRQQFVSAQIQRADDDRIGFERRCNLAIGLILLLLGRGHLAIDEQIFRAEQPDAFRAAGAHGLGIRRLFDVRGDEDAVNCPA